MASAEDKRQILRLAQDDNWAFATRILVPHVSLLKRGPYVWRETNEPDSSCSPLFASS